jgi:hypothetical protein
MYKRIAPTLGRLIKPVDLVKDKALWGWFIHVERYFTLKIVVHRLNDTSLTYLLKLPSDTLDMRARE